MHITVKQGLDIPILGGAHGSIQSIERPREVAFDFRHYDFCKFRVLVEVGSRVVIGQPLAEDKERPERKFVSPAAGTVVDIRRGEKRKLMNIVISVDSEEKARSFQPFDVARASRQELQSHLLEAGFFAHIRARPFSRLADPVHPPRSIFVKAIESAPFVPSAEMQLEGNEEVFEYGLQALQKLTQGSVHLVFREGSCISQYGKGLQQHTVSGPHPSGNSSVHIHAIDPIKKNDEVVWTISLLDVIAMGAFLQTGKFHLERIVALCGTSITEEKRRFVRARFGHSIAALVAGRIDDSKPCRLVSGDPLTGDSVEQADFLGVAHTTVVAIEEPNERQMLSFFRLGGDKYTASGAYLSGHMNPRTHRWKFTTSQHGEERAFIDGSVYERVVPMRILPVQLVRAIMAEDFEMAELYGLLEVDAEDFALAEFVDPCKIPMMDIVRSGLTSYAKDILG